LIKVHYMHIWKHHSQTLFLRIIYVTNKIRWKVCYFDSDKNYEFAMGVSENSDDDGARVVVHW
jgi:hypothetical protein